MGRDDKDRIGLGIGNVDDAKVPASVRATDCHSRFLRTRSVLEQIAEGFDDLMLLHAVSVDVSVAFGIDVEPNVHARTV